MGILGDDFSVQKFKADPNVFSTKCFLKLLDCIRCAKISTFIHSTFICSVSKMQQEAKHMIN